MELGSLQDETKLIAKASAGSAEAFEVLLHRHQDRVFGLIHRLVGDYELSRDLTQETFLKAWKGLSRFKGGCAFYTWLYRIARNVVTSRVRYDAARPRFSVSLEQPGEHEDLRLDPEASAPEPLVAAETMEHKELVLQAISRLPAGFREIVILRDMQDLSYEDIAEILEIPLGTVRSRLHRARAELKERLEPLIGPEE